MLLVASAMVLITISCEKEYSNNNGNTKIDIPSQVNIKVGASYSINSTQSWSSNKTFVATVSSSGTITGQHVGSCTVSCPKGCCQVNVTANTNLFRDPITEWGLSKSAVIARAGSNYQETSSGDLAYETGSSVAPYLGYSFTNGVLSSTLLMVKTSYTNQVVDHLSERYRYISQSGNVFYFSDDGTTGVYFRYYNSTYWAIQYAKL